MPSNPCAQVRGCVIYYCDWLIRSAMLWLASRTTAVAEQCDGIQIKAWTAHQVMAVIHCRSACMPLADEHSLCCSLFLLSPW